jgi:ribokinase
MRKAGSHIAFNPSSYQAKMGKKLYPVLKLVDVLIFNLEEACLLMGKRKTPADKKAIRRLLISIAKLGPKIVVITNALDGTYAYSALSGHCMHAHGRKVKVKETTGAGDAFASSFIAGLMHTNDIHHALHYGMINAESVVENYGAHNILLSRREIEKRMKKIKRKTEMF